MGVVEEGLSYIPSMGGRSLYGTPPHGRQRSPSVIKKPPEPLRRAVADCLSAATQQHHVTTSASSSSVHHAALPTDAEKTLRDYVASPSTCDMAYIVLIEHALHREIEVVPRCVALLKRYLLRYIPKVQTLRQIDNFCMISIVECEPVTNRRVSLWSKSLSQQSGQAAVGSAALSPSTPISNFASASLVKSLNYVRSLVARHIPKLSFQPLAFSGASYAANQSLPTLSSFLSKSFASQVSSDVNVRDSPKGIEVSGPSISCAVGAVEEVAVEDINKYIPLDLLEWRWSAEGHQPISSLRESNTLTKSQDVRMRALLEVGAAALLVGDLEAKVKGHSNKYASTQTSQDVDELLQPSSATAATNFASSQGHLKAITASKRMKPGPDQVWMNVPVSNFQPRAHPLFQYRHYSEQQPLHLNLAEVCEVISEICSDSPSTNTSLSARLTSHKGRSSTDVAASVLIKLVIDMYMMDCRTAGPLTQSMLEDMIISSKVSSRVHAFDLVLNLGVHAHLLEPTFPEEASTVDEVEVAQDPIVNSGEHPAALVKKEKQLEKQQRASTAIDNFEAWILDILFKILHLLVQVEESEEIVWASALSCLFYFVCHRGKVLRKRMEGLDIRVIQTLLEISRERLWSGIVHSKLIFMLTSMFYCSPNWSPEDASEKPVFMIETVDLLGGIDFICFEYSRANSREERRSLYLVLVDYVLYQMNEAYQAAGVSTYSYDEIHTVVSLLTLADAPEAFFIVVKHGVKGMGDILRNSISAALSKFPNYERLNLLLDNLTRKLESMMSIFNRLDDDFSYMLQMTKSFKLFATIADRLTDTAVKTRLSWATLHSLLHSEVSAYRHHGYIWLVELLVSEIAEDGSSSIWSNIQKFEQDIGVASNQDLPFSAVPLPISMMCGLLKSRHNFIRWGFLFVLDKLLIRCKFVLDESAPQKLDRKDNVSCDQNGNLLDKANAIIDIMSSSLSLMVQINETDHINILKMCDILLSQLCLRLPSSSGVNLGDLKYLGHLFGRANESFKIDLEGHLLQKRNSYTNDIQENSSVTSVTGDSKKMFETASMAALLLRGHAIVPMQLVAHVPESLFYWPLIQLAGAATDDIALGVAVGSNGRGNLPGATSDIRAAILLLLIGKCTADPKAFQEVEGEEFFRGLLDDTDSRVAYYSSAFLLKRMMTEEPEKYQKMLQSLVVKAQQSNNEKLLENPYLQMRGIIQLSNDMGAP